MLALCPLLQVANWIYSSSHVVSELRHSLMEHGELIWGEILKRILVGLKLFGKGAVCSIMLHGRILDDSVLDCLETSGVRNVAELPCFEEQIC